MKSFKVSKSRAKKWTSKLNMVYQTVKKNNLEQIRCKGFADFIKHVHEFMSLAVTSDQAMDQMKFVAFTLITHISEFWTKFDVFNDFVENF